MKKKEGTLKEFLMALITTSSTGVVNSHEVWFRVGKGDFSDFAGGEEEFREWKEDNPYSNL